jgi:hypothetical protein
MICVSTRNACAISPDDRPQSRRRMRVTCVSTDKASSQIENIIAS